MNEKNLWSKLGIIVVLTGMCLWQIYPPDKKLKPGIDLGGGHSLLFEIDDSGDVGRRADLAASVMDVLKQRVDPQGSRNLVWRPIGRNRLEIQMPRVVGSQKEERNAFDAARKALADTTISAAQVRAALALPPERRAAEFERLTGIVTSRRELFARLAAVADEYAALSATATQPTGETARRLDQLFVERNQIIDRLLATNVDPRMLTDLLELGRRSEVRAQRLEALKKDHSDLAPVIEAMVSAYDRWSAQKGMLDDPNDLMRLLRGAGKLEFRILARPEPGNPDMISAARPERREPVEKYRARLARYGPRPLENDAYAWFEIHKPEENDIAKPDSGYIVEEYLGRKYVLAHATPDMGLLNRGDNEWTLRRAMVGRDRTGQLAVNFSLDPRGGAMFSVLTGNNIEQPLCIFLDDKAMSAAIIRSQIGTDGQISGRFTEQDVVYLVQTLEAGVLPARLKEVPLQQKSVGPSLGDTNKARGTQAVVAAFLLTVVFMAVYYTYSGCVADIALLMNLVLTLGVMSFIQATFTLPGIAGLVLMLGMAVDANVLIYERMREELQRGVSVRMAVKLGYEKAFSAILDSNVTTIMTAVILGSLGSEELKGFGLTLGIGLCTSMFTALFVTRQFFNVMVPTSLDADETRKVWLGTGVLALAGGAFLGLGWALNRSPELRAESGLVGFGSFLLVMFATALVLVLLMWLFRLVYHASGHQRANRMPMLKLLSAPNIDWMSKYKVFWGISVVVIVLGAVFFDIQVNHPEDLFDIEFVGGTSVQVEIRPDRLDEFAREGDKVLLGYVSGASPDDPTTSVGWLRAAAGRLREAEVASAGEGRFTITAPGDFTTAQMSALLLPVFEPRIVRGGIADAGRGVTVQFDTTREENASLDAAAVRELLAEAAQYATRAADKLRAARVQGIEAEATAGTGPRRAFEIVTTETSKQLVAEALLASMRPILQVTETIEAVLRRDEAAAAEGLFPIRQSANTVGEVIGGQYPDSIAAFKGGVMVVFDDLQPPTRPEEIKARIRDMRLQPDFEDVAAQDFEVFGLKPAEGVEGAFTSVAVAVVDPSLPYVEGDEKANQLWRSKLAERQLSLVQAALATSRSLQRVTVFAPQVAGEATQKAIIAIILSLMAIAAYLWVRFGSLEFGLSGVIALYHDVSITLSAIMVSHYIWDTPVGRALLLQDFRIDLNIIAALLTIVGFSINDTIVIFDRIRENRGRLAAVSSRLINDSLNQTLSRTIITTVTVLLTVLAMYILGGDGIHGFAFAMLVGCLSGTYSTLAIATPMVQHPRAMWVTTIGIAALTAVGLAMTVQTPQLRIGLVVLTLVFAAYAIIRVIRPQGLGARPVAA